MFKNETIRNSIAAVAAASIVLAACGRPNSSSNFDLDGAGNPRDPAGNVVPGKFGGSIEVTRWNVLAPSFVTWLFGGTYLPDFTLSQAFFNESDIAGLGGFGLLIISVPPAPAYVEGGANCYMDIGITPQLGGNLASVDVGQRMLVDYGPVNHTMSRSDDGDVVADDFLIYINDNVQDLITYDSDLQVRWDGGSLGNKGFQTAPERDETTDVVHFPDDITGPGGTSAVPTVNGAPMSATATAAAASYQIQWERSTLASTENLLGTQIIVTIYGPSNVGEAADDDGNGTIDYQVEDSPYLSRLSHMVCTVDDENEEFTVDQAMIDQLLELARSTGRYQRSTEDTNGNGILDTRPCGGGLGGGTCVEDANGNGTIDKIYGASLVVNRRTQSTFDGCLAGSNEVSDCNRRSKIFISANAYKSSKIDLGVTE